MSSLTSHLLALDPLALDEATKVPFVEAAAKGTLPTDQLVEWLGQDRLYQLAYVNFVGAILARVPVPNDRNRQQSPEWRVADVMIDFMNNARHEIDDFEHVAAAQGWMDRISGVAPNRITRAYQDLFAGATAQGRPLIVAIVVLWATELCYLRAWRYARDLIPASADANPTLMQSHFIPIWSSPQFEGFVKKIADVVDLWGDFSGMDSIPWKECEVAWRQVLWAEREFWPSPIQS